MVGISSITDADSKTARVGHTRNEAKDEKEDDPWRRPAEGAKSDAPSPPTALGTERSVTTEPRDTAATTDRHCK